MQLGLDVEGVALPASLATSFAVQGTTDGALNVEGLQLPAALPGSSVLDISAGVGRYSAILSIARQFFKTEEPKYVYGYEAVAQLTFFPLLSTYLELDLPTDVIEQFEQCSLL